MQKKQFVKPNRMNVFKMSLDELESTNKGMEKELKKLKIPLNGNVSKGKSPSSKRNINLSPVNGGSQKQIGYQTPVKGRMNSSNKSLHDNPTDNSEFNSKVEEGNNNKFGTFEYQLVKKEKILIPATERINMKNLKICQKNLLPKEKNYFVSEKNFQLIAEALNAKEIDIKNLKTLLDMAHQELNKQNEKFEGIIKMNEIFRNKHKDIQQENTNIKMSYDDLMFQINKMNNIFGRLIKLLKYIMEISDSEQQDNINQKINELELNGILSTDSSILSNNNQKMNATINKFFNEKELQNEKLCIEYKKKYYDAQNIADQITQIDSSNINLTDIARDMLETKKRIKELNDQNEKLEHENTYLRISYQNLYCENEGKNKSNNNQVNLLNKKIKEISEKNGELSNEIQILKTQNEELEESLDAIKNDISTKTNLINDLSNKNSSLSNTVKDKDNIITELKRQVIDLTKKNTIFQSSKQSNANIESHDDLNEYLNKSSDDITSDPNKRKGKINTSSSKNIIDKKDLEIKLLKQKISDLQNDDKNIFFEGDTDDVGVNGVQYIGDMFMILYNQAKMIEGLTLDKGKNRKNSQIS